MYKVTVKLNGLPTVHITVADLGARGPGPPLAKLTDRLKVWPVQNAPDSYQPKISQLPTKSITKHGVNR